MYTSTIQNIFFKDNPYIDSGSKTRNVGIYLDIVLYLEKVVQIYMSLFMNL